MRVVDQLITQLKQLGYSVVMDGDGHALVKNREVISGTYREENQAWLAAAARHFSLAAKRETTNSTSTDDGLLDRLWFLSLDARQQKQVQFSRLYARDFQHGADSHNNMVIIDALSRKLDEYEDTIAALSERTE